jgi:uncharacterized protein
MIIDFHTHVVPPEMKKHRRKYLESDPVFALLYENPKAALITADDLIKSMDENDVDVSVIQNIGWTTHDLCVETNDYIMDAVRRYPNRLYGFGAVQPNYLDGAIAEIGRLAAGGLKGIGELRPDTQFFDLLDDELMRPFMDALKQNNMMLCLHSSEPVGHQYPGKGIVTPDLLAAFVSQYREQTIILAHWGGGLPFYALMPEIRMALENVYFDSAASPFLYEPQIYRQVAEILGAEHILFGSDHPLLTPKRLTGEIDGLNLPAETRELILAGNARRLLGID